MPSQIEIEKIRRDLSHKIINKKIASFKVLDSSILRSKVDITKKKVASSYIKRIDKLGTILSFKLASGYYLLVSPSTHGQILFEKDDSIVHDKTQAIIEFKSGSKLHFIKLKRFGYLRLLSDRDLKRFKVHLGINPMSKDFSYLSFRQLLKNKSTSAFNFLTSKKYFQGIDKDLAERVLSYARVSPGKSAKHLSDAEKKRIFRSLKRAFK
jgi:formamidopyrimidine-DNA glycosylase